MIAVNNTPKERFLANNTPFVSTNKAAFENVIMWIYQPLTLGERSWCQAEALHKRSIKAINKLSCFECSLWQLVQDFTCFFSQGTILFRCFFKKSHPIGKSFLFSECSHCEISWIQYFVSNMFSEHILPFGFFISSPKEHAHVFQEIQNYKDCHIFTWKNCVLPSHINTHIHKEDPTTRHTHKHNLLS